MEARRGGWHRARVTHPEAHVLRPWSEEPPLHPLVPIYAWERLPEYMDTQKLARHLGRIFASLPPRAVRRHEGSLARAAARLAMTICALNIEGPGSAEMRAHAERSLKPKALRGIEEMRRTLTKLREDEPGSEGDWDLGEALGLLDGVEARVRATRAGDINPEAGTVRPPRPQRSRLRG